MPRERIPKSVLLETLMQSMSVKREMMEYSGDEKYRSEIDEDLSMINLLIHEEMEDYFPKSTILMKPKASA